MEGPYGNSNRVEVPHRRMVVNTQQFSIDCEIKIRILVCDLPLLIARVKYINEAILNKGRLAALIRLFNYMLYGHANDRATKTLMVHHVIFLVLFAMAEIAPNALSSFCQREYIFSPNVKLNMNSYVGKSLSLDRGRLV